MLSLLSKKEYSREEYWFQYFENGKKLTDSIIDPTWFVLFELLRPKIEKLEEKIKAIIIKQQKIKIYPLPKYVFSSFLITSAENLKVVILGQDPYFNCEDYKGKYVPQAMGLSFSVPNDIIIPSSLRNIFSNLIKFKHIKNMPKSGNLWFWATQGCLMLNTIMTVEDGQKESHQSLWKDISTQILSYIVKHFKDIIFLIWGSHAYEKINNINIDTLDALQNHHLIISSHPSGLSANKPFKQFPAFMDQDHFGKVNEILEKKGKTKILWQ